MTRQDVSARCHLQRVLFDQPPSLSGKSSLQILRLDKEFLGDRGGTDEKISAKFRDFFGIPEISEVATDPAQNR